MTSMRNVVILLFISYLCFENRCKVRGFANLWQYLNLSKRW